jgi:glucose-1-phosphate adenylyltransferase
MNNIHGIILAYSSAVGMRELTEKRTATAVPFGARYRTVDFVLSNMINSGITDVGLVMRENYQSLLEHVGSGREWDLSRKIGGLRILPPFALTKAGGRDGFRGKLEALSNVFTYIKEIKQKYVALVDGEVITNIDISSVLERHISSAADITIVCTQANNEMFSDARILFDKDGYATDVITHSELGEDYNKYGNGTLGLYILGKDLLQSMVERYVSRSLFSFEKDVLQEMCRSLKMAGYIHQGYCARIYNTVSYFNDSMRLLESGTRKELFNRKRAIRTRTNDVASTYYAPESMAKNCLIADGCHIEGNVENSILFKGVYIKKGAKVSNCILMQDSIVGEGSKISYTITDKDVIINSKRELKGHSSYPLVVAKDSVV